MISDLLFYCWFTICTGIMAIVLYTLGDIDIGGILVILLMFSVLFFGGLFIVFSIEDFIKKLLKSKSLSSLCAKDKRGVKSIEC